MIKMGLTDKELKDLNKWAKKQAKNATVKIIQPVNPIYAEAARKLYNTWYLDLNEEQKAQIRKYLSNPENYQKMRELEEQRTR